MCTPLHPKTVHNRSVIEDKIEWYVVIFSKMRRGKDGGTRHNEIDDLKRLSRCIYK